MKRFFVCICDVFGTLIILHLIILSSSSLDIKFMPRQFSVYQFNVHLIPENTRVNIWGKFGGWILYPIHEWSLFFVMRSIPLYGCVWISSLLSSILTYLAFKLLYYTCLMHENNTVHFYYLYFILSQLTPFLKTRFARITFSNNWSFQLPAYIIFYILFLPFYFF